MSWSRAVAGHRLCSIAATAGEGNTSIVKKSEGEAVAEYVAPDQLVSNKTKIIYRVINGVVTLTNVCTCRKVDLKLRLVSSKFVHTTPPDVCGFGKGSSLTNVNFTGESE